MLISGYDFFCMIITLMRLSSQLYVSSSFNIISLCNSIICTITHCWYLWRSSLNLEIILVVFIHFPKNCPCLLINQYSIFAVLAKRYINIFHSPKVIRSITYHYNNKFSYRFCNIANFQKFSDNFLHDNTD